ncbi:enoyl-CoA hydratase-related protein [Mycobacterium sp. pUA109]|uniref:enoyl-CoA hydratase-related protein n=1 Tax=Mycobacterium sp. pUA109 TaxID=3238982 RepID=UPI00351BC236
MAEVEVSTSGDVVTIRLNRPDKRNAITAAMYTTLADALIAAEASAAAVVVLTGAGGTFTAGNDLQDMRENPPVGDNPSPVRFLAALTGLHAVLVAAVDGPAIGVGTTVLLHCDLVYATSRSTFRLPFVDLGLVPEAASTLLLPRLVGHLRAAELMLFGETIDADTAANVGMVTAVVADGTALDQLVAERTAALVDKPRAAVRATKGLLIDSTTHTVPARLALDRRVLQSLLPPTPDRAHDDDRR